MDINIAEIIQEKYLELDYKLYEQSKLNKALIFKGYRWKRIVTSNGIIRFKRRIYFNNETNKYVYLLDQKCNFKKYTNYDPNFLIKLQAMFYDSQISLAKIQTLFQIDKICFSKMNYWKIAHKCFDWNIKARFVILEPYKYKHLYINIDDTYLNTIKARKYTKKCFRILCCHQGKDEQNQLVNKYLLTINIKNKSKEEFVKFIYEKLELIYGNLQQYKLIVLSDGALVFKYLAKQLNAKFVLDKFHLFRNIRNCYNFYSKTKALKDPVANERCQRNYYFYQRIIQAIYQNNFKQLNWLIYRSLQLENLEHKIKEIQRLRQYLFNNWHCIVIWNNKKYYTKCLTETFVQAIIKKIKGGVGKIYSTQTIEKIISYKAIYLDF